MTTPGERSRSFPNTLRVTRAGQFRAVFDHGRSRSDGRLVVYARPHDLDVPPRLGLVIGRRFGDAVHRNAWKRILREAFRLHRDRLPPGHDAVVLPAARGIRPSLAEATESLLRLAALAAADYARRGPR